MNLKTPFILLVSFLMALMPLLGFGQEGEKDGYKSKLNDFADNALIGKEVQQEVVEKEKEVEKLTQELAEAKSIIDSTKVIDSLKQAELEIGGVTTEEAKPIDTVKFEQRVFGVKARTPQNSKREAAWAKKYLFTHANSYKKEHELDTAVQVFGWHPFWMGTAYKSYNFSLLSTIAYFSYELNPQTGGYKTIHDWKTTALVDSAKVHGCKVLLSVTNFGKANNAAFLSNQRAQANFINTLISLLKERNADGVNIDFEAIPRSSMAAFNNFIIDLSSSLRSVRSDYKITLAIPALDFDNVYDIGQLNQYIDTYIMMGYEFYGKNSTVAGPVSPLESGSIWSQYDLITAVSSYSAAGVPMRKLLVGLPYYGAEWETRDLRFPSKAKRFVRYPMYRDIRKNFYNSGCCLDEVSKSKFYVYRDKRNNYRQIWYEDSTSLGKKYDWIKEQGLGGVGIWALGYDNGYPELWQLLASKFALSDQQAAVVAKARSRFSWRRFMYIALRGIRNPQSLLRNPRWIFTIFGSIFGVSMVSFFMLYRFGNRFTRISKLLMKSWIVLLAIAGIALIYVAIQHTNNDFGWKGALLLLLGCVIGIMIFLLFSKRFLSEKDLP